MSTLYSHFIGNYFFLLLVTICAKLMIIKCLENGGKMEYKKRNVSFNKAGGTAHKNSYSPKISLPKKWLDKMKVTVEDTEVDVMFDNERIVISKSREDK